MFTDDQGEENVAVGLKGHVLQIEFPPEYADWRKVDPSALIDAPLDQGRDRQVGGAGGQEAGRGRPIPW